MRMSSVKTKLTCSASCDLTSSMDNVLDSFSHVSFCEEQLKDDERMRTYREAMRHNQHLFKDKVVLDVGCGTGILSLFAAEAGARRVLGVDDNPSVVQLATAVVRANKLDHVVEIVRGKMDEITLPVDTVDVIVSEWMGFCLVHQSRLSDVLYARDRYLVPGGVIFPDRATLWLAGIEDAEYKTETFDWWAGAYGFDMRCMGELGLSEPLVLLMPHRQVMTSSHRLWEVDLTTVKRDQLGFTTPFSLQVRRDDYLNGFVVYFDVTFSRCRGRKKKRPVGFSTAPSAEASR